MGEGKGIGTEKTSWVNWEFSVVGIIVEQWKCQDHWFRSGAVSRSSVGIFSASCAKGCPFLSVE